MAATALWVGGKSFSQISTVYRHLIAECAEYMISDSFGGLLSWIIDGACSVNLHLPPRRMMKLF